MQQKQRTHEADQPEITNADWELNAATQFARVSRSKLSVKPGLESSSLLVWCIAANVNRIIHISMVNGRCVICLNRNRMDLMVVDDEDKADNAIQQLYTDSVVQSTPCQTYVALTVLRATQSPYPSLKCGFLFSHWDLQVRILL